jgi:hypothetical protein
MRTATRLRISVANNVTLNLNAVLSADGRDAALIAELEGNEVLGLLEKELSCSVENPDGSARQGRVTNIIKNGRKQLIEVCLRPFNS